MFVFGLTVSAIFAPQWRVLHVFQALIYVALVALTRRKSAWGFGAGVLIALFWNYLTLIRSPVGRNLIEGHGGDPSTAIQVVAACGHFVIIFACLAGFLQTRPASRQWAQFATGGVFAIGYLLAMAALVGPPEGMEHIKAAFGL